MSSDTASSSMRIGLVTYEQFGPFEEAAIDFSAPGVTVIEGRIVGVKGCDSNGAGKSMPLDGIAWCLYDRCIREEYNGDAVIRSGAPGGCRVTVDIVGGPKPVRVRRHRKWTGLLEDGKTKAGDRVQVWVGGEETTRGNNPLTNLYIEEKVVGIDFATFVNAVAFGAHEDVKGFFTATDADRKRLLETILGLSVYAEAEKVMRGLVKTDAALLAQADIDIAGLRGKAERNRDMADRFSGSDAVRDAELEVQQLRLKAKLANRAKAAAVKAAGTALANAKLARQAFAKAEQAYDEKRADYDAKVDALLAAKKKLERDAATYDGEAKALSSAKGKLAGIGKECPTCRQAVAAGHVAKLAKQIDGQVQALGHNSDAAMMEATAKQQEADALEAPPYPDTTDRDAAEQALADAEAEMGRATSDAGAATTAANKASADYDQHAQKIEELIAEAKAADASADELKAGRDALDLATVRREFWVQGFGNQGLKSFLLEAELPWINSRATARAQQLLGEGSVIRLAATTELKSKVGVTREKMSVEGTVPGMARTYAAASKGQKRRMSLCLLLAVRDLTASRSAKLFDQLFVDEVFDGMDRTGTEAVADMLTEMAERHPVVLITHDDRLKSVGDRTVVVNHDGNPIGGKATIEVTGATKSSAADTMVTTKIAVKKAAVKKG